MNRPEVRFKQPLPRQAAKTHALTTPTHHRDRPRIHHTGAPCTSPHYGPDGQPVIPGTRDAEP